jgi:hypothetical protein
VHPAYPQRASGERGLPFDLMADKSPKKSNSKKAGKSLKEKRADKQAKRDDKRPGIGG